MLAPEGLSQALNSFVDLHHAGARCYELERPLTKVLRGLLTLSSMACFSTYWIQGYETAGSCSRPLWAAISGNCEVKDSLRQFEPAARVAGGRLYSFEEPRKSLMINCCSPRFYWRGGVLRHVCLGLETCQFGSAVSEGHQGGLVRGQGPRKRTGTSKEGRDSERGQGRWIVCNVS